LRQTFRRATSLATVPLAVFLFAAWNHAPRVTHPDADSQPQQDRVAQLRARFDKENDPIRKAKILVPLGTAEFDRIEKQIANNDANGALAELRDYEDKAASCGKALDARNVDAEKHPNGYKELEISVRESLRRLNNVMVSLAGDEQKPFEEIRKSLDELNQHLISQLFPKAPPGSKPKD
jgi:hypothetical protein